MTVLVTGAAGLTGGAVVRLLAARGERVLAVVRREEQRAQLMAAAAEVAIADCADPAALAPLLARADALVHVAGIHLGSALAASGELARPARAVAISTAGILSRHRASVAVYRAGEEALRRVRPDITLVRPTMIYGSPLDRNVHHVIGLVERFHALPLVGDGQALLQPIHYEDLAAATVALLDADAGEPVPAGGAAPLTLREAALAIFAALGVAPRLIRAPRWPALVLAGAVDAVRGSRLRERILRLTEDRSTDNTLLVALTGIHPRTFAEGVRDEVRAIRAAARA